MFINQYLIIKDLGKGAYGTVKLVYNTEDDMLYAMKVHYSPGPLGGLPISFLRAYLSLFSFVPQDRVMTGLIRRSQDGAPYKMLSSSVAQRMVVAAPLPFADRTEAVLPNATWLSAIPEHCWPAWPLAPSAHRW